MTDTTPGTSTDEAEPEPTSATADATDTAHPTGQQQADENAENESPG